MNLQEEFIGQISFRMRENLPRISTCLAEISEKELWIRPNALSNSIGNLLLHLCGNIRQYGIATLGGEKDQRQRDMEFSTLEGQTKQELYQKLEETVERALQIAEGLTEEQLLASYKVQVYEMSGLAALLHICEHLSYHTGQIAFYTKLLKNCDLGFYKGLNLSQTH